MNWRRAVSYTHLYVLVISVISPYKVDRYIFCVYPLVTVALFMLLSLIHIFKGFDLTLPRNKLIVFTGLSGCGKSSLAFDTLYA